MCAWSRDERERRETTSEGQQGAVGDRSERWSRRLYEIQSESPRMCGGSYVASPAAQCTVDEKRNGAAVGPGG